MIHGIRGDGEPELAPGGTKTVCTEETLDRRSGRWACVAWLLNEHDLPVVTPRVYLGPCGHVVADQATGAWTCLSPSI